MKQRLALSYHKLSSFITFALVKKKIEKNNPFNNARVILILLLNQVVKEPSMSPEIIKLLYYLN